MLIPTDQQIRALHEKFAPTRSAFELVHTHCEIVCEIAARLLPDDHPGVELVRAGSLLHDIGVYRLYSASGELDDARYIRHGVLGHDLLAELGFAEAICRFCSCHTGVGLTRDDVRRQELPIPVADYLAESVEEEVVMYADKFHSKTTPPTFVSAATYLGFVQRFGEDKVATFAAMREKYGDPDLGSLSTRYGHPIR